MFLKAGEGGGIGGGILIGELVESCLAGAIEIMLLWFSTFRQQDLPREPFETPFGFKLPTVRHLHVANCAFGEGGTLPDVSLSSFMSKGSRKR